MTVWATRNARFRMLITVAEEAARDGREILLVGEPGVGRERLAWYLHAVAGKPAGLFLPARATASPAEYHLPAGATLFLQGLSEAEPQQQERWLQAARQGGAQIFASASGLVPGMAEAVVVPLPPLRERRDDLELLTHSLLSELTPPGRVPPALSAEAIAAILLHGWPGNVSELKRALRRAIRQAGEGAIDLRHLPPAVAEALQPVPPKQLFRRYLRSAELFLIRWALSACGDDRTRAARFLGLSRAALYKKLKLYPEFRTQS